MRRATVIAQAKVNLFLRILAREATGWHQLETLFCRLRLGDAMTIRAGGPAMGRSLDVGGPALPAEGLGPVERNLAWRAAQAFAEAARWPQGFAIEIDKHIPVGGGLGGGSADAGAVLRALNALAPTPLAPDVLLHLAATLGADVPVLTQESSPLTLAFGRGERMLALAPLPARPCLLFVFGFGVPTAEAYGWVREGGEPAVQASLISMEALRRWEAVTSLAHNDFERAVATHRSPIGALRGALDGEIGAGTLDLALLSGSGATILALPALGALGALGALPPERADVRALTARMGALAADAGARVVETSTADSVEPVRVTD